MIAAALVLGLAAVLLVGPPPQRALGRLTPAVAPRTLRLPAWVAPAGMVLVALGIGLGLQVLAWTATLGVLAGTGCYLVLSGRRRAAALRSSEAVAKAARVLSGLLRSGQIPTVAIAEAAADFEVLRPAATAAALGGDVAAELERSADQPGREGLRAIAAAWRISERSGAPVADVLALVAQRLREQRRVQAVIETELAAARSSGRIMAFLPVLACGLGLVVGVNTFGMLFGDPVGQALLFVAVGLTAGGVLWIDWLARATEAVR